MKHNKTKMNEHTVLLINNDTKIKYRYKNKNKNNYKLLFIGILILILLLIANYYLNKLNLTIQ
jgi:hypothetical protein